MPLSAIDIYKKLLPKTNCGDCGYRTCLAFASMVVSEKLPLKNCPYIAPEKIQDAGKELERTGGLSQHSIKDQVHEKACGRSLDSEV